MREFTLLREYHPEATIGKVIDPQDGSEICQSLERPKTFEGRQNVKDNPKTKFNESCCIPEGRYLAQRTMSHKFKKMMWEIIDVDGRGGIRIHTANYVSQLEGCIALCMEVNDKGKDQLPPNRFFASESQKALEKFSKIAPDKFFLNITSMDTLCDVRNIKPLI